MLGFLELNAHILGVQT